MQNIRIHKGFSLVELMVTVAVLAILATIGLPAFQGFIERHRMQSAVEAVYAQVQFLKSEAIKSSQNVNIRVVTGSDWCIAGSDEGETACDCNADDCAYGSQNLKRSIKSSGFSSITLAAPDNILIDGVRGGLQGLTSEQTLTLSANGLSASIKIKPLGQVSACSSSGIGAYQPC